TWSAALLLDPKAAAKAGTLGALTQRGLPVTQHDAVKDPASPADVRALHARAHMDLARLYWTAADFDQVLALLSKPAAEGKLSDDLRLVLATAIALAGGPEDAAAMMLRAPLQDMGIGSVGALDSIAK